MLIQTPKEEIMKFAGSKLQIISFCAVAALLLTFVGCGSPSASEPDNFQGIKWGTDLDSIQGLTQIATEGERVLAMTRMKRP